MHGAHRGPAARGGGRAAAEVPDDAGLVDWLLARLPDEWFTAPPEVVVDREEVVVVGTVAAPEAGDDVSAAEAGRIARFREGTRDERVRIAREVERRWGRTVSWGAQAGGTRQLFTTQSVPVMTRLRQPERRVLDTLVEAGVARSRADALAWCVKLVGRNADAWLAELRDALQAVQEVRAQGPA